MARGNTTGGVVRVGDTVRRPATAASKTVDAFLQHLNDVGYSGAPRTFGFDELGRHVVEYVEGPVLMPFVHREPHAALRRVGRLLRDLHDAAEGFVIPPDAVWNVVIPPDRADLVVHHDAAPWNLVTGPRWVLIDWDTCGPGSRLWDLSYAAHGFVPMAPETSVEQAVGGLTALADGYGLDEQGRSDLCDLLVPRIVSMYELLLPTSRAGSALVPAVGARTRGHLVPARRVHERSPRDVQVGLAKSEVGTRPDQQEVMPSLELRQPGTSLRP